MTIKSLMTTNIKDLVKRDKSDGNGVEDEVGTGLEAALVEVKKIDRRIANTLNRNSNGYKVGGLVATAAGIGTGFLIAGPLGAAAGGLLCGPAGYYSPKIPGLRDLVVKVREQRPLSELESEIRGGLNSTLVSLVRIGQKAQTEKKRIEELEEVYNQSIEEDWSPADFRRYIGENTDVATILNVDGADIDMESLFEGLDLNLSPERQQFKKQEYRDWMRRHIDKSYQYLDSMRALCVIGYEWADGMRRSYFDITKLRSGAESIEKTMTNIGRGGSASLTSEQALREYGTTYLKGMKVLLDGYEKMHSLKDKNAGQFQAALTELQSDLNTLGMRGSLEDKTQRGKTFLLNELSQQEE